MSKKKKIIIIVIVILLLAGSATGAYFYFKKDSNSSVKKVENEDVIKEYGYTIKKTDSKIKKQKFKELKQILKEDEVDYEAYAAKLAELFAVDVYDLNSKINKYDIGGLEYILDTKTEEFKILMQDTLYSNIKDNTDNDRKQDLPVVKDATKEEITSGTYTLKEEQKDSYDVKIKIDYKEDLGYDKNVLIKMIKKENKLFIVLVEPY